MELIDFDPAHLKELVLLERNAEAKFEGMGEILALYGGFTMRISGQPVACGGLIRVYPHRLIAWSAITDKMPVLPAVRLARKFLDKQDALRIETVVDCEDPTSQRWVEALGFRRETDTPLRAWNHDGSDAYMYVRLKHGH